MSSIKRMRNTEDIESALFPSYEITAAGMASAQKYNYIMVDFKNKHHHTTDEGMGSEKKHVVYLKKGNFKQNTDTQILYHIPQADIDELKTDVDGDKKAKCIVLTKLQNGRYEMVNDDAYASIYKTDVANVAGAKNFMVDSFFNRAAVKDAGKYRLYYTDFLKAGTPMINVASAVQNLKDTDFGSSSDPYVDIGVGKEHAVPDPIILKLTGNNADGLEMEKYWAKPLDASVKADVNSANIILGKDHIVVFNTTKDQKKYITDNTKTGQLLVGKQEGGSYVREDKDDKYTDLFYSLFTTEWRTRLNDGAFVWAKDYITKEHFKQYNDMTDKKKLLKDVYRFYYLSRQDLNNGTKIVDFSNNATVAYGFVPLTLIDTKPEPVTDGFKVNDIVLYKTHDDGGNKTWGNVDLKWTPSEIVAVNADGTYNLRQVPTPQIYLGPLFNSHYPNRPNRTPVQVMNAAKADGSIDYPDDFNLRSNIPKAEIKKPSDVSNWQQFCNDAAESNAVLPPSSRSVKSKLEEKIDELIKINQLLLAILKEKLL